MIHCRAGILAAILPVTLFVFCCAGAADQSVHPAPGPVYRIPLRVHLGKSSRKPAEWRPILEEINTIWLSQAGICFEMHTVANDEKMTGGLDIWFHAMIDDWNGYYHDPHDMHVRDDPVLGKAAHPARSSAARTAAHELGHALNLRHRQDSDDNLMRSKTYGWRLDADEIRTARENARILSSAETGTGSCSIRIGNNP